MQLTVVDSRLRNRLYGAFCVACLGACWAVLDRGYLPVSVPLALACALVLWQLRRGAAVGVQLRWRQGVWTLRQAGQERTIVPTARSTLTPWVVFFAFEGARDAMPGQFWIYADSVSRLQWRLLRVRLTLRR
jgi:hypothetical protein